MRSFPFKMHQLDGTVQKWLITRHLICRLMVKSVRYVYYMYTANIVRHDDGNGDDGPLCVLICIINIPLGYGLNEQRQTGMEQ